MGNRVHWFCELLLTFVRFFIKEQYLTFSSLVTFELRFCVIDNRSFYLSLLLIVSKVRISFFLCFVSLIEDHVWKEGFVVFYWELFLYENVLNKGNEALLYFKDFKATMCLLCVWCIALVFPLWKHSHTFVCVWGPF